MHVRIVLDFQRGFDGAERIKVMGSRSKRLVVRSSVQSVLEYRLVDVIRQLLAVSTR